MKYLLIAILILNGCKKDDTREVIMEWERTVAFDEGVGYGACTQSQGGNRTFIMEKGQTLKISVLNCSMPKVSSKLKVYVNDPKKDSRDKTLYEDTKKEHELNLIIP